MKKTIAFMLALTICLACVSLASAERGKEYYSSTIKRLDMTSSQMTRNKSNRVSAAALALMELMVNARDGMSIYDDVSASGNCYIAAYGSCLDIYYPSRGGKYLNIFVTPSSGRIKDYGFGSYDGSSKYTYYKISMSEVWSDMEELIDAVYN